MVKRILFISGSVGLGHVVRDLVIAKELRKQIPDVELSWLASEPAATVLSEAGEKLVPEADKWAQESDLMENVNKEYAEKGKIYSVNLAKYLFSSKEPWSNNVKIFKQLVDKEQYDLVIGDEAYEITIALRDSIIQIKPTFVMFYDFIGLDTMTNNPLEKLIAYKTNKGWIKGITKLSESVMTRIFIGELEDVPDKRFGFLLPNRRKCVKGKYNFVGYILPFNPEEYTDRQEIRKRLGYGNEPILVCSIGGTSVGQPLLELCAKSFSIIKDKIPDLCMVLVSGPRISGESFKKTGGLVVKEYIPKLYEHFAACDLAIVQGGSTTTLELTALGRPFIYFPIEGHAEQQLHVAPRLKRFNAGIKMQFSKTTPEILAEKVISNIRMETNYSSIPLDGAKNVVKIINKILEG
jgi:UDP:flavonoid glycosyltransferase YjiC (YdhE family)